MFADAPSDDDEADRRKKNKMFADAPSDDDEAARAKKVV